MTRESCRRCKSCGKAFNSTRQSDMWDHLRTQHPDSEQTRRLPVQEPVQLTTVAADRNPQNVPGDAESIRLPCDKCPKTLSRRDALAKHKDQREGFSLEY